MELTSWREVENTRAKLKRLEDRFETSRKEPGKNAIVKDLSLRSLKRLMNQLKEEIARFEARAKVKS